MRQDVWAGYEEGEGDKLTELRVHGAGGAPVPEMLDSENYVRVAGDDTAGFYRIPESDRPLNLAREDPRYASFNLQYPKREPEIHGQVEAYYWGKLSSGGGWRAFWILLLPFAIINLAGWNSPRSAGFTQRLVRLFGLVASTTLVYWITAISIGVLNECGPGTLCAERKWYLGLADISLFRDQPSRLAVVGLVLGALVVFALWWWPGRRSADEYERFTPGETPGSGDAIPGNQLSVDGPALWYSERFTKKLSAAHVLAMLSAIAAGGFVAVGETFQSTRLFEGSDYFVAFPKDWFAIVLLSICLATLLGCAIYVLAVNPLTEVNPTGNRRDRRRRDPGVAAFLYGLVLVFASAAWIWSTGVLGEATPSESAIGNALLNRAYQKYANTGFLVLVAAILLLSAALLIVRAVDLVRRRNNRYSMGGFGPALLPLTALVIMAAMVSGSILFIADLFGEPDYQAPNTALIAEYEASALDAIETLKSATFEDPLNPLELAQLQAAIDDIGRFRDLEADLGEPLIRLGREYYLMPLAFMLIVFVLAVIGIGIVLAATARIPWKNLFRDSRIDRPLVMAVNGVRRHDQPSRTKLAKEITADLRKPYRNARFHALLAFPAVLALISLSLGLWRGDWVEERAAAFEVLLRPAVWLTVGVFVALAFVVRDHYGGGASRGILGGVWDIITFWPRFYHPFAPPSYAVRSVPEVAGRIRELTGDAPDDGEAQRLILSAHSQGVPTTLAAISLIPEEVHRERLALLTYGSPTGMLYGRFFPDYFDSGRLSAIGASLSNRAGRVRWSNLWRLTDWTGGYCLGPSRDRYFPLLPLFGSGELRDSENADYYVLDAPPLAQSVGEHRLTDPDPVALAKIGSTDPMPAPNGHSDYLHDRLYFDFRQRLVDELYGPDNGAGTAVVRRKPRDDVQRGLRGSPPEQIEHDDGVRRARADPDPTQHRVSFFVNSRPKWNSTSKELISGYRYLIVVDKTYEWRDARRYCGADGWQSAVLRPLHFTKRNRSANWLGLVATIGEDEAFVFPEGQCIEIEPSCDGHLRFYANDAPFMYWNNSGELRVEISGIVGVSIQDSPSAGGREAL